MVGCKKGRSPNAEKIFKRSKIWNYPRIMVES